MGPADRSFPACTFIKESKLRIRSTMLSSRPSSLTSVGSISSHSIPAALFILNSVPGPVLWTEKHCCHCMFLTSETKLSVRWYIRNSAHLDQDHLVHFRPWLQNRRPRLSGRLMLQVDKDRSYCKSCSSQTYHDYFGKINYSISKGHHEMFWDRKLLSSYQIPWPYIHLFNKSIIFSHLRYILWLFFWLHHL